MNEALRLLRKLVVRAGYDIKKSEQFVLRPVKNLAALEEGGALASAKALIDQDGPSDGADLSRLRVYVRTCMRVDRNVNPRPRIGGAGDEENALRCLTSLVHSVNEAAESFGAEALEVVVLDDRSDTAFLSRLEQILSHLTCSYSVRTTKEQGQGKSLHEQFSAGRGHDALLYFVEDDYLHERSAIREMWEFYQLVHKTTGGYCLLYPQEHGNLYSAPYPSYIVAGPERRWRTMADATHTFLVHGRTVERYWDFFENTKFVGIRKKRHLGVEKNTTNKLFDHIPGFSPIPALAVHFQYEDLLPPFFDWRPLWEANKPFEREQKEGE